MERRKFLLGLSAFALTARIATAADKALYKELTSNPPLPNKLDPGKGLKALAHTSCINDENLPWVTVGDKTTGKLLMVDLADGLWIVRAKYEPGAVVTPHYHTGPVLAFTISGEWFYKEYPEDVNRAGTFLYEPSHSLHTLVVPDTNTEITDVWFAVRGANLNLDENNEVESVTDANSILEFYQNTCKEQNLNCDKVLIHGV